MLLKQYLMGRMLEESIRSSCERGKFKVGDWVFYHYPRRYQSRSMKWQKAYIRSYLVVRIIEPVNCILQKSDKSKPFVAHVDKLKRYYGKTPEAWVSVSTEPVEVVDEICCKGARNRRICYYSDLHKCTSILSLSTFLPLSDAEFEECRRVLRKYVSGRPAAPKCSGLFPCRRFLDPGPHSVYLFKNVFMV